MIGATIAEDVRKAIQPYQQSALRGLVDQVRGEPLVIKFVSSRWAERYATPQPLKISTTPALTWGTATYVTPLAFPLSSVLYGRIGLVGRFDPSRWQIFDATSPAAQRAYIRWAQAQATYTDLMLTVHSTYANHVLRNKFRKDFKIDCVLFHPDQEAELHTDLSSHIWMAVTDWTRNDRIATKFSSAVGHSRFTVLIDEEFELSSTGGFPIRLAKRKIEGTTASYMTNDGIPVSQARSPTGVLAPMIAQHYANGGYVHVYLEP
jgi:hypothetical protein